MHSATPHFLQATLDLLGFFSVLHKAHLLDVDFVGKCSPTFESRILFSTVTALPSIFFFLLRPSTNKDPCFALDEKSPTS